MSYYVLLDESGTLPDPRDKYIVVGAIGLSDIKKGIGVLKNITSSLRKKEAKITELKFYYAGERTRRKVLSGIVLEEFEIFVLIVDKQRRKIADTPENFALFRK